MLVDGRAAAARAHARSSRAANWWNVRWPRWNRSSGRASSASRNCCASWPNREAEPENSLRLHRERLRQVSENSQREVAAQIGATIANLRNDFEGARKEALSKWGEELDAAGVRASHAAAESIGRSSEWFQQEARARLQVLVEQALVTAGGGFDEKTAEAGRQFEAQLAEQSSNRLAEIHQQLDEVASEFPAARIRKSTQLPKLPRRRSGRFCAAFPRTRSGSSRSRSHGAARTSASRSSRASATSSAQSRA